LRKSKTSYENEIKNLLTSLAKSEHSSAQDYIISTINELDAKIKQLDKQIQEYTNLANTTHISESEFEIMAEMFSNAANSLDNMTVAQKRTALRSIIRRIEFDGENVHIYFFGADDDEIDLSDKDDSEPLREGCK
jgi:site-specific DNA recombinase